MTAKQWAARAVMAAAMAAGLSACGGGGDGAAPAVAPTPEELTAGLTIKSSTDAAFEVSAYGNMKIQDTGTDYDTPSNSPTEYGRFAQNNEPNTPNHIELMVRFSKATNQVTYVTLVKYPKGSPMSAVGCGFSNYSCDNKAISVNPTTKEIRITSLSLKSLAFTTTSSDLIIFDDGTKISNLPGTVVASGVMALP
jgi:hypothetical protein